MNRLFLFLVVILLTGCIDSVQVDPLPSQVEGLKPVYIAEAENVVEVQDAIGFENLGKIVYANPYLLINERFKGIHIVDNSNPSDPVKIAFLKIPGNTDFTLKGQYLYANHGSDLKTFLINGNEANFEIDLPSLEETQIISDLFSTEENNQISALFPPDYQGFFECVDPDKGIVVGWESSILTDPECRI